MRSQESPSPNWTEEREMSFCPANEPEVFFLCVPEYQVPSHSSLLLTEEIDSVYIALGQTPEKARSPLLSNIPKGGAWAVCICL